MSSHGGGVRHICPLCATRRLVRVALHARPADARTGRWMKVLARFAASGILLEIAATTTDLVRTAARRGWQTVTAPPTIREGLWRAGSFDAVFLCGLLHTMPDPDALLRLAAHYCRLDGLLLVEMPTIERDTMLQALAMRLQRHGFRLCWHGCLPALDGPHDTLQLTAVARYVP